MTVPNQIPLSGVDTDGVTYLFGYNFLVPYLDDGITPALTVYLQDSEGVNTLLSPSTYAVTGVGNPTGGFITYPLSGSPVAAGYIVLALRALPYNQPTAFPSGQLRPQAIETALDRAVMQLQQLYRDILLTGSGSGGLVASGVSSFNTRTGAVTLESADVTSALGYVAVNRGGDAMTGRLVTAPSTTDRAGLNVPAGTAPTSPADGDLWSTVGGLFGRFNGTTRRIDNTVDSVNGQTGAVGLTAADVGAIPAAEKGAVSGVATLDTSGLVPVSQLPPLGRDTFVVANQAARLALAAVVGDFCVQTDTSVTYVLAALPASTNANWTAISASGSVNSVNGLTGVVELTGAVLGRIASVVEYGAVVDGTTDDTAAWNAAIADLNAGNIDGFYLPPGISVIAGNTTQITRGYRFVADGEIKITGGTSIVFDAYGLSGDQLCNVTGVNIFSALGPTRQYFRFQWLASGTVPQTQLKISRVNLCKGFTGGIEVVNCVGGNYEAVNMHGNGRSSGAVFGWKHWAAPGWFCLDHKFLGCTIGTVDRCWTGYGDLQGFLFDQCVPGFSNAMWDYTVTNITLAPCFEIRGGQSEFFEFGARFENAAYISITGHQFYATGGSLPGAYAINLDDCFVANITDNVFLYLGATPCNGIWISNTTNCVAINGNQHVNPRGICELIDSGCTWITSLNNRIIGPVSTTYYQDSAVASENFRRGQIVQGGGTDTGRISGFGPTGTIAAGFTIKVSLAMPCEVGDLLTFTVYVDCTGTAAGNEVLQARVREYTHRPSGPSPYQVVRFAYGQQAVIDSRAVNGVTSSYMVMTVTGEVVARATDAVFTLELSSALGNLTGNVIQYEVRRA